GADEQDVVRGDALAGFDDAEKAFWQGVIAAHPVKETRGAQLRGHSGADGGDQEGGVDELEQPGAAGPAGNVDVGGVYVGKLQRNGPDELRPVDLERCEHAGDQAGEDGGAQDIAAGIFHLFGERGNAIKANVSERGDGG